MRERRPKDADGGLPSPLASTPDPPAASHEALESALTSARIAVATCQTAVRAALRADFSGSADGFRRVAEACRAGGERLRRAGETRAAKAFDSAARRAESTAGEVAVLHGRVGPAAFAAARATKVQAMTVLELIERARTAVRDSAGRRPATGPLARLTRLVRGRRK